jgi:hypothetical protein
VRARVGICIGGLRVRVRLRAVALSRQDDEVVVAYDGFPKARVHLLLLPKVRPPRCDPAQEAAVANARCRFILWC